MHTGHLHLQAPSLWRDERWPIPKCKLRLEACRAGLWHACGEALLILLQQMKKKLGKWHYWGWGCQNMAHPVPLKPLSGGDMDCSIASKQNGPWKAGSLQQNIMPLFTTWCLPVDKHLWSMKHFTREWSLLDYTCSKGHTLDSSIEERPCQGLGVSGWIASCLGPPL